MSQIIIHDDGETWALAESVKLYDITDAQYHELANGRSPKHMGLVGVEIHSPYDEPGKEAAELREGIENLVQAGLFSGARMEKELRVLLESTDARDSLRYAAVQKTLGKEAKKSAIAEFLSQPATAAKIQEVLQKHIEVAAVGLYKQYGAPAQAILGASQRALLALEVFKKVEEQTESLEINNIGSDLAYLMAAIVEDKHFEVSATEHNDPLIGVLHRCFDNTSPVWGFITNEE